MRSAVARHCPSATRVSLPVGGSVLWVEMPDDVAALCGAMDLILGPANATTNIAAACGAPVWLLSTPAAWPRLGTDRYPWYPQVRVFSPPAFNEWAPVMRELAEALAAEV